MTDPALTDRILRRGKALVRAIERAAARLLLYAYKRRLRGVVEAAPAWMVEKVACPRRQQKQILCTHMLGDSRKSIRKETESWEKPRRHQVSPRRKAI
jgi:hypothetical protein